MHDKINDILLGLVVVVFFCAVVVHAFSSVGIHAGYCGDVVKGPHTMHIGQEVEKKNQELPVHFLIS